jgi:hypothetical protein
MGLGVAIGMLADLNANDTEGAAWLRDSLGKVNAVLAANGLPAHAEPEVLPLLRGRASLDSYPYSILHYLRRFAAHAKVNPKWKPKPFPKSEDPAHDPVEAQEAAMMSSHLLCHSDAEGFYVPIDFPNPLVADADQLPGVLLGSSQGLMRALIGVAPFLGIKLASDQLSDIEADRINQIVESEGPFWIELAVWYACSRRLD